MKCMVDIPHELILSAAAEIDKKRGVCNILPRARFSMCDGATSFYFDGLVCDERMGGKQTGVAAAQCRNCALEKEEAAQRASNSRSTKRGKRSK